MLFETLSQPKISLIFLVAGLFFYIIYFVFNLLKKLLKNNIISNFILDIVYFIIITLNFYYLLLNFNYGELRFYILFTAFLGYIFGYFINKLIKNFCLKIKNRKVLNNK